jgi:hypothetical protein
VSFRAGCTAIAVPLLALVPACIPQDQTIDRIYDPCEPLLVTLSAGTSAEERQSAEAAAALWNELLGGQLSVQEVSRGPSLGVEFREAAPAFFGLYDDERGQVIVNRRIHEPRARTITVAHEIGHALGLSHVAPEERLSVMNPANLEVPPSEQERAALAAIWGECGR